jgi:hypothetical protein
VNIGITGTRSAATRQQLEALGSLLEAFYPIQLHHGDCVGVDEQAHDMAEDLRMNCHEDHYEIVIHPPNNKKFRAFCKGDIILPPKEYLERNKDIVRSCHFLIAVPKEMEENLRSGTWATVRFAIKTKTPVIVIYPDGSKEMK